MTITPKVFEDKSRDHMSFDEEKLKTKPKEKRGGGGGKQEGCGYFQYSERNTDKRR